MILRSELYPFGVIDIRVFDKVTFCAPPAYFVGNNAREALFPARQVFDERAVYRTPLLPGFELSMTKLLAVADQ